MEACLPTADEEKITGDLLKLVRKGRAATTSLLALNNDRKIHSWIVQISGTRAFFSTVHYADTDLFVSIYQFHVDMPTCTTDLLKFSKSLQYLFMFKNYIEQLCELIKPRFSHVHRNASAINQLYKTEKKTEPMDLDHLTPPSTSNWYTPPQENRFRSLIPVDNQRVNSEPDMTKFN